MHTIYYILVMCVCIYAILTLVGYGIYKYNPHIENWETGVKKACTFIYEWVYENMQGKPVNRKVVDTSLILSNSEILELVKRVNDHPYETPSLASFVPNSHGISWVDISSIGLISKYKDLSKEDLQQLCYHIIANFFMETRNYVPYISIKVAIQTRLYFAIALSEDGKSYLMENEKAQHIPITGTSTPDVLEEVIDIFDEVGDANEIRL